MHVLLSGVVGSTTYGLAGPDSDVDRKGVFALPTVAFHGLHQPTMKELTVVKAKPDATWHEALKVALLSLNGNPGVAEILWLPEELIEVCTPLGEELIGLRTAFLSAPRVRGGHLDYAATQFQRLLNRGDGSFSSDTRKRTRKHAIHLRRLCVAGLELYRTGRLTLHIGDPEPYFEFGDRIAAGETGLASKLLWETETAFDAATSPLPDEPDRAAVEAWLLRVRRAFLDPP